MVLPPNNQPASPASAGPVNPQPQQAAQAQNSTGNVQQAQPQQPTAQPTGQNFNANGAARSFNSKVAVHITPLGGNRGQTQSQPVNPNFGNPRQQQAQQNQNGYQNGAYQPQQNNHQNGNWGQPGNGGQNHHNRNQQQYRVNDKLTLDFSLLDNSMGQRQQFIATKLGSFLDHFAKTQANRGIKLDVTWDHELGAYYIRIGQVSIMWVTGMSNPNSPAYQLPIRLGSWYGFEQNGSKLTQFAMQNFNRRRDQQGNLIEESFIVLYDDDIEYHFVGVAYLITKSACPDIAAHITEDQFLNRNNGFNIVDTNEMKVYNANPQYIKETENQIREFIEMNSASSIKCAGDKYIAISVTDSSNNQWMNYGGGFGQQPWGNNFGGGGLGYNSAFGGFGSNGGFGVSGYQQPRTKYIAAMRYYITQEANQMNGSKMQVIHITELCELGSAIVENWIKYVLAKLSTLGYMIQLDLDIGKLTPNMRDNVTKYFAPAGGYGASSYKALTVYINRTTGSKLVRIAPSFLTLPVFKAMYPQYEKDAKFPKDLSTADNRKLFEEYKHKEGFVQYLNAGTFSLYFDGRSVYSIQNDYNGHQWAASMNMTFDEAIANQQNQQPQNPQGYNNPQWNQPQNMWRGNGQQWGSQWGQQNAWGGQQQWGNNGWNNPQPMFTGGYQQFGGQQFGNNFGGYPQNNPIGPNMGSQPYPVQQGVPNGMMQQRPYHGQPQYMGGQVMGGQPYAGPMGYPQGNVQYQPGMVAGGAFPGGPSAGGYIPS